MSKDVTRTEILYAYGRLQEQDDLPENCNDFMLAASLEKLEGKHYGLYQVCPLCNGNKFIPGSHYNPDGSVTLNPTCTICKGEGIIVRPEVKE